MADSKIYTTFTPDDIILAGSTAVTETCWSAGVGGVLELFYTSSTQVSASGDYFYNVYQADPSGSSAEVQFAIAYGNADGNGSYEKFPSAGVTGLTPSLAIYEQYANTLWDLTDERMRFEGHNGSPMWAIMAVNFQRERVKEAIDLGNWEMKLSGSTSTNTFIDDSHGTVPNLDNTYYIVSGSLANGVYNSSSLHYYGIVYHKQGVLIFDASLLEVSASIGFDGRSGQAKNAIAATNNNSEMFKALVGGGGFSARNKQTINSNYYFVRVKNSKYNYSNNPSYYTGSYGSKQFRFPEFQSDPVVYITTIGLYDNSNGLLAVAKLSQPIKKTKTTESLIRVCLNF